MPWHWVSSFSDFLCVYGICNKQWVETNCQRWDYMLKIGETQVFFHKKFVLSCDK